MHLSLSSGVVSGLTVVEVEPRVCVNLVEQRVRQGRRRRRHVYARCRCRDGGMHECARGGRSRIVLLLVLVLKLLVLVLGLARQAHEGGFGWRRRRALGVRKRVELAVSEAGDAVGRALVAGGPGLVASQAPSAAVVAHLDEAAGLALRHGQSAIRRTSSARHDKSNRPLITPFVFTRRCRILSFAPNAGEGKGKEVAVGVVSGGDIILQKREKKTA